MRRGHRRATDASASYRDDRVTADQRFDEVETSISHLFRRPHPALNGRSYGGALWAALTSRGLIRPGQVTELGGGTGAVARAFVDASRSAGVELAYNFVDLSATLLHAQRRALLQAACIRADAVALPFKDGSLRGLFLANEVIADLSVKSADEPAARALAERLGLEARSGTWLNIGALQLIGELGRVLAPGAAACLTEFGGDFPAEPVQLEGRRGRGSHVEHSIHFGHLEVAARSNGLSAERVLLADLLGIDRTMRVASYPDCVQLRRFIPALPILAHPREDLASAHPFLTRFFAFDFPEIGSPRFPDPQAGGGLCQLFWALLLTRPTRNSRISFGSARP